MTPLVELAPLLQNPSPDNHMHAGREVVKELHNAAVVVGCPPAERAMPRPGMLEQIAIKVGSERIFERGSREPADATLSAAHGLRVCLDKIGEPKPFIAERDIKQVAMAQRAINIAQE